MDFPMRRFLTAFLLAAAAHAADVKPVPPPGIPIPAADRADLDAGLDRLGQSLRKIHDNPLAPDVQIFHNAVRYGLQYDEFFKPGDIAHAKDLLRQGQERADALIRGSAPWTTATGLVVRGYVSKIDRSVQPYGLVVPPS